MAWILVWFAIQGAAFRHVRGELDEVKRSDAANEEKNRRLDDLESLLEMPLYVGLFGSVTAFLVITFAPQTGRVAAYASTLFGILASALLKFGLVYPYRKQLRTSPARDEGEPGPVVAGNGAATSGNAPSSVAGEPGR